MHKGHMTGCILAIGFAVIVFTATGGSIGALGLLLAVLICPITMGAVMGLLMGSPRRAGTTDPPTESPLPSDNVAS